MKISEMIRGADVKEGKAWEDLPDGWDKESLKKFWKSIGGSVGKCIKAIGKNVDDPGAFCSSIADVLDPGWRKGPRK